MTTAWMELIENLRTSCGNDPSVTEQPLPKAYTALFQFYSKWDHDLEIKYPAVVKKSGN